MQIFIYDHNKDQVANYAMDVLNNPDTWTNVVRVGGSLTMRFEPRQVAGRYVAGVAYHWYSGDGWDQLDRLQAGPAG